MIVCKLAARCCVKGWDRGDEARACDCCRYFLPGDALRDGAVGVTAPLRYTLYMPEAAKRGVDALMVFDVSPDQASERVNGHKEKHHHARDHRPSPTGRRRYGADCGVHCFTRGKTSFIAVSCQVRNEIR
jgi:hypothetical protein